MEPISDPFEFEHVLELLGLAVAELPLSQDVLEYRLNLLIDDALSDLKREHVSANGTQLTTNEEAAAEWLIALRHARRQLKANGTLTTHALDEIKTKGWIVMAWRFWNSVHALHERKTAAQKARQKWFKAQTEYSQVRDAAKRLLSAGTHPRNLVSSLRHTAIGQEIESHTLRLMLQQQGLLPSRKPRKKKKSNDRRSALIGGYRRAMSTTVHRGTHDMAHRLLDGHAVDNLRARGRTQRYDDVADGLLPLPIKIGRMSRWPEHEIDAIVAAEIRGDTPDQIRQLARDLVAARASITASAA